MTDECQTLKDEIEDRIRNGKLSQFVEKNSALDRLSYPGQGGHNPSKGPAHNRLGKRPLEERLEHPTTQPYYKRQGRGSRRGTGNAQRTIQAIFGGFACGGTSKNAKKGKLREVMQIQTQTSSRSKVPPHDPIIFDHTEVMADQDDALVIALELANQTVLRCMVDPGSSADILHYRCFKKLGLTDDQLYPYTGALYAYGYNHVVVKGCVDLLTTIGDQPGLTSTIMINYLVIDRESSFNIMIGRIALARWLAVPSTVHQLVKFPTKTGRIGFAEGDLEEARRCYMNSLDINAQRKLDKEEDEEVKRREIENQQRYIPPPPPRCNPGPPFQAKDPEEPGPNQGRSAKNGKYQHYSNKRQKTAHGGNKDSNGRPNQVKGHTRPHEVFLVEMDPRDDSKERPLAQDPTKKVQLRSEEDHITTMGTDMPKDLQIKLEECLIRNHDLFAWTPAEMPGVDPRIISHKLSIPPGTQPVAQKKRRFSPEKLTAMEGELRKLLTAGFIKELQYAAWLSNVVMVPKRDDPTKPIKKWRKCTDFRDLNKHCPKDPYPLPNIDSLVDNASGYEFLSFMDAYSGYNQIFMDEEDMEKTAFITDYGIFCYKVMPFGLKNAGATYQRLMDRVFSDIKGKIVEVYVDDLLVKTSKDGDHVEDLQRVFDQLRLYNIRLNPDKCMFGVRAGKFLGFMLTQRGIEANPDKCEAIINMKPPTKKKEIQELTGRLASLSRFLPKSAVKALPIFELLKKEVKFQWTETCEKAFQDLKQLLSKPPVLTRPREGEILYVYLSINDNALASVLVREDQDGQQPIYFVSKVLQGAETRYQKIEKLAYALVVTARRLRQYFQAHTIMVRTDQPIKQVLQKTELAGRMINWSIELTEFDIHYEPRTAIKSQALSDFVVEFTRDPITPPAQWTIYVDGSSNSNGSGAGVIVEGPDKTTIEQSLRFGFKTTNNQAEYEALIAGLLTAKDIGVKCLTVRTDSQLVASQVNGTYQVHDDHLKIYLQKVKDLLDFFIKVKVEHITRDQNEHADLLSKLASIKSPINNRSVVISTISQPAIAEQQVNFIEQAENWMTPIRNYIQHGALPSDRRQAKIIKRSSCEYTIYKGTMYKRGMLQPLLKCVGPGEANYIITEIHEGICGQHPGGRTIAAKALRAGYYWPTMKADCIKFVRMCSKCQQFATFHNRPADYMAQITAPWPFAKWGLDLLGPFPIATGQRKYLVVAIDYFTKWIEADPLATITSNNVRNFVWKNIVCRFGLPESFVVDNGTQFTDKTFKEFCSGLHIQLHYASVEHPQSNGLAESANKNILNGLKKRLDDKKGLWVDELPTVLWAIRTTPQSSTKETPFRLAFGVEAMIPVEIGEQSIRRELFDPDQNNDQLREELDFIQELRDQAHIANVSLKDQIAKRYNKLVRPRAFQVGDLVLRRANMGGRNAREGKLAPNWEGPYRVHVSLSRGAYELETLKGKVLKNTFNGNDLRYYYA